MRHGGVDQPFFFSFFAAIPILTNPFGSSISQIKTRRREEAEQKLDQEKRVTLKTIWPQSQHKEEESGVNEQSLSPGGRGGGAVYSYVRGGQTANNQRYA